MGTAGGVRRVADRFDETFVVVVGDTLTDINVREIVAFYREREALATLALVRGSDTAQHGVAELNPERDVLALQEKPDSEEAISTLADPGVYVLEPAVLEYVPENSFSDFARIVVPHLLGGQGARRGQGECAPWTT